MKLQLYLNYFSPDGANLRDGVSKAMDGLAHGLTRCGATVIVICEGPRDSEHQRIDSYAIRCIARTRRFHPFSLSPGLTRYLSNAAGKGPIILNGMFSTRSYAVSRVLRRHAIPYVVAPHDPYHPSVSARNAHVKWPYWYLIERRLLQNARAIQILDARHEFWLRRLGIKTPVIVAPNGFHAADVLPESSLAWRDDEPPRLFYLGRRDAYNKGLDLLLHAFAITPAMHNATLSIQGLDCGDDRFLLRQAQHLGIAHRVQLLTRDLLNSPTQLIANYDIFCLPSRFEGFGLAALEAMLAGRVVLVSDVGGIATHVRASSSGVIVKAEVDSIAAGLADLIACRPQWQSMGLRGRHYVLEHLNWETIAADMIEQYRRIMPDLV